MHGQVFQHILGKNKLISFLIMVAIVFYIYSCELLSNEFVPLRSSSVHMFFINSIDNNQNSFCFMVIFVKYDFSMAMQWRYWIFDLFN